jgi:hypothetical protein
MDELVTHLLDAPVANVLILAGLAFLAVGVFGKISGKLEPGTTGRVASAAVGAALLIYGIYAHSASDARRQVQQYADAQPAQNRLPRQGVKRISDPQPSENTLGPNQPAEGTAGLASHDLFSGVWENDNPKAHSVTKLRIEQRQGSVLIQAWRGCTRQDCDWGTVPGLVAGGSVRAAWDQGSVVRKMTLLADGGRLRMELENIHKNNEPEGRQVEYFVKSQ